MIEELKIFGLLLNPKRRGLRSSKLQREGLVLLRALFWLGLAALFGLGIYAGAVWFLRGCLAVELIGELLPRKILSLVLLLLVSVLFLSATINSFSVFYLSEDLGLLLSAPVPIGPLYYARFTEMFFHSAWMVFFFGLPVFLAYARVFPDGGWFLLRVLWIFPVLLLIPAALGAMAAGGLTYLFSARRARDLMIVLVMLAFVVLYLLFRAIRPERLLDKENFGNMMDFLAMFGATDLDWLPTSWVTEALVPLLHGRSPVSVLPVVLTLSSAASLVVLAGFFGTWLYEPSVSRAQEGRISLRVPTLERQEGLQVVHRGRALGTWLDRLADGFGPSGVFWAKDVRVFWRDTAQWLQLLLLLALAVVYLLNFYYLRGASFSWFELYTANHFLLGLVLSGVAVRFVFPAVSLEGRAYWTVRVAPVDLRAFLHSKLLIALGPLAFLGVGLALSSCWVIDVPRLFAVLSVAWAFGLVLPICCLGIGLGAIYPRFHVENTAKIPTGVGGVSFMVLSLGFFLLYLASSWYPLYALYLLSLRNNRGIVHANWLWLSLAVWVVLILVGSLLPMVVGRRSLAKRED